MSNPFANLNIPISTEDVGGFRGDLDPEIRTQRQIERCAIIQSSGDETTFAGAVMALLAMIPTQLQLEVEDEDIDYIDQIREWQPVRDEGRS